jgi:hypothetical protein
MPQAGLPAAAQSVNPYEDRLNELALKQPVAPTTQDAISRVNELSPAAMKEAALQKRNQEMRDRATGYMEKFEKGRPSGLDDLIRVFGQAGQYKGLSGLAPAYTSNKQQQRAEELAATKQFNEMMNLADKTELEGSKDVFGARTRQDELARQLFGKDKEGVLKATADLYTGKQRSLDEAANRLNNLEVEKLRIAERQAERNQPGSAAKVRAEYLRMMDQVFALEDNGEKAQADALRRRADARLTAGSGSGTAGVGAARNAISERRLEMAGLEKIMKDEAMVYSDEEKKEAAKEYRRLALLNSKESGGSPSGEIDKSNPLLK